MNAGAVAPHKPYQYPRCLLPTSFLSAVYDHGKLVQSLTDGSLAMHSLESRPTLFRGRRGCCCRRCRRRCRTPTQQILQPCRRLLLRRCSSHGHAAAAGNCSCGCCCWWRWEDASWLSRWRCQRHEPTGCRTAGWCCSCAAAQASQEAVPIWLCMLLLPHCDPVWGVVGCAGGGREEQSVVRGS